MICLDSMKLVLAPELVKSKINMTKNNVLQTSRNFCLGYEVVEISRFDSYKMMYRNQCMRS